MRQDGSSSALRKIKSSYRRVVVTAPAELVVPTMLPRSSAEQGCRSTPQGVSETVLVSFDPSRH